jgi:hypothetical protein
VARPRDAGPVEGLHRRSSWLTRAWLALLLLVPLSAGCDAGPRDAGARAPAAPPPAAARPPTRPRVHNQAVPPGPRRPAVSVRRAKAGKPNPKLRQAVVQGAREARARTLAAKRPGAPEPGPVADARPWRLPPAPPAPPPPERPAPHAEPRPTVTPEVEPAATPARTVADAPARASEGLDLGALDWTVPLAFLAGIAVAILFGLRRP